MEFFETFIVTIKQSKKPNCTLVVFLHFDFPGLQHDCQAVKQKFYHLKLKVNLLTDVSFIRVNVELIIIHFQAAIINVTFKLAQ